MFLNGRRNHATVQRCASGGRLYLLPSQARLELVAWNPTGIVTETEPRSGDKTQPGSESYLSEEPVSHSAADRRTNIVNKVLYKMQSS